MVEAVAFLRDQCGETKTAKAIVSLSEEFIREVTFSSLKIWLALCILVSMLIVLAFGGVFSPRELSMRA